MNASKHVENSLKYALAIILWLTLYSITLELITAYKTDKAQCQEGPKNRHNAIDTDDIFVARL